MIYNGSEVATAAVDQGKDAIERIRNILKKTGAKIDISSVWRSIEFPNKLKDLLKIWDLDQYWYADNSFYDRELMKEALGYFKKILTRN